MKRLSLTLPMLLASFLANAAITEKYASAAGAGAHDGSSEANAFSWTEMITDINAGGKAGNRYNYKGDIARTTTSDVISGSGTVTAPVIIRGYLSTIGDGYQGRTNGNLGLITSNMPSITYTTGLLNPTGTFLIIESLQTSTARNGAGFTTGGDNVIRGCKISNAGTGTSAIGISSSGSRAIIQNCDFALTNGGDAGNSAMNVTGSNSLILGCRVTSSATGIRAGNSLTVASSQIYNCAGIGITNEVTNAQLTLVGNTFVGGSSDAVGLVSGNTAHAVIINNMITDNAGWAINMGGTANKVILSNNRTRDNTSGQYTNFGDWPTGTDWGAVTTDTGGPETDYVNTATTDYNLISTSPGFGVGIPRYSEIGALQKESVAAAGTSATFLD